MKVKFILTSLVFTILYTNIALGMNEILAPTEQHPKWGAFTTRGIMPSSVGEKSRWRKQQYTGEIPNAEPARRPAPQPITAQ